MKLTILGSGTATPILKRNNSGYLLDCDNKQLLFDSGAGTIRRLLELKINLFEINNIFYTHLHNDHINDLGAIIWGNNYGGVRKKTLNLYGPHGFKKYCKILIKKLLRPTKLYFKLNIAEFKNSTIKIGNITISTYETKHSSTTKSIVYRIEHKDKTLVYTGDTEYCEEIITAGKNVDAMLIECSFPDDKKIEGHLTPSLVGELATKANAKQIILTHFYPEVLKTNIKKHCSKRFKGKIILAQDKMKIYI